MTEPAGPPAVPVHAPLASRRSTRAFDPRPVDDARLASLFEAARWAPSSGNEQPWRFVVTRRGSPAFATLLATLTGNNPRWAHAAAALVVTATKRERGTPPRPNAHAWHDAGIAWAMLAVQAVSLGLAVHPMGGFDAAAARAAVALPDEFDLVTVTALGWPGDAEALEESLRARELAPRTRRPLEQTVSEGTFGAPAPFLPAPAPPAD